MVDKLPPDELLELFQVARQVVFRYQLDKLEVSALRTAMRSTEKAAKDILSHPTKKLKRWEQLRRQELIREIDSLTLGIREQVSGEISSLAGQAGAESAKYHSQTMSLGGKVAGFNNVALSPEQFRSFFQTTPLGGATLNQWVNKAFDATVRQGMLEDLGAGVLQGKGYRGLVNNIMGHMEGFTRKEAVTLARSFVQQANVTANDAVMAANRDIIKKWKWSAVLEGGNMASGNGTCIRCAVLDQQEFEFGEGPPMILHPRCRCVKLPVLVSYRDLGIDVDELEDVARPWTERPDIPIGEGSRNITSWGTHKGEYASWFNSRGEQFQKNVVGPKRLALIQSGKVTFKDLVDPNTGRLYRLDELVGGPRGGGFIPASTLKDAEEWARNSKIKDTLFHGTGSKSEILKKGFSLDVPVKNGRINGDGVYFAHQVEGAQGWGGELIRAKVNVVNPVTYDEINKGTALPLSFRGVEMDAKYAKKGGMWSNWDWIEEIGRNHFPDDISSVRMAKVFKEMGIDAIIDPRTHAGTVIFDPKKIRIIKD